ncbi:hypothetical protein TNCV_884131 [Trichonephila clavipes]|nr:hypothetical protein TNCV_884131 [Trichonephila clavipes]
MLSWLLSDPVHKLVVSVVVAESHGVSDAKVIAAVIVNEKMPDSVEAVTVDDTVRNPKISHSKELKIVEAFQHFEQ